MDVRLFCAVLWRFKRLVIGGFLLAAVLAVFAYGTPGFSHGTPSITPHGAESWQSQAELLITESSFPYGRAAEQYAPGSVKSNTPATPVGDQQYMAGLAPIYAALANGNVIQGLAHKTAPVGTLNATEVTDAATAQDLPFVELTATAPTSSNAAKLSASAASVLVAYVAQQQTAAAVPAKDRVELQVVRNGRSPQLVTGHKVTLPLLVFMALFGAAIALAFILESVWPRTAAALGRVPGGPGQGSLAPSQAAIGLNRGGAIVRLDHLLAGMDAAPSSDDEPDQPEPFGQAEPAVSAQRGGSHPIDGEEYVTTNGGGAGTWRESDEPRGGVSAAMSLWDAAQQNWAASQKTGSQAVAFRSDSGE